jgi:hypothetical protein
MNEAYPDTYIWIDAICINQSDNAEKGIQVQNMGRIYSHALKMVGWLGFSDNAIESTMNAIQTTV